MSRIPEAGATDTINEVEVVLEVAEARRRVVLVEDDLPLRDVLADEIRDIGYEVIELTNGFELLEYFHGTVCGDEAPGPEVVVAEVELPGLSGTQICELLRKSGAHVPFILIAPKGIDRLHRAAIEAGAERVLDKPFAIKALTDAVTNAGRN